MLPSVTPTLLLPIWGWLGCAGAPPVEPEPEAPAVVHVRGGVVVDEEVEGTALPDGRTLVLGVRDDAPDVAECVTLFSVDLGDATSWVARGGSAPDTAVAFSPDGSKVAVGTFQGLVLVADAWTGEVVARRTLPEALIRLVHWLPDGSALVVGEQSPDANLLALDPADLHTVASMRLADEVHSSPPPPGDDAYGVYTLPAAYDVHDLPGGDLLVSAVHGWNTADGRRNASRLLRLRPEGEGFTIVAGWPASGPADAVFGGVAVDPVEKRVAVAVRRSADGAPPADLPVDGVQVLDDRLVAQRAVRYPVLAPHFDSVFVWEALGLRGHAVVAGMGDGRVAVDRPGVRHIEPVGAPVISGDVPIAASVGYLDVVGDLVVAVTNRTNIPYGVERPNLRPPAAHPGENRLWGWRMEGTGLELAFAFGGPYDLQGLSVAGRQAVVGAGPRQTDERTDLFGMLAFDLDADGDDPLVAVCPTESPVFWRHALSADGRIAAIEIPHRMGDEVRGSYRLTVMR